MQHLPEQLGSHCKGFDLGLAQALQVFLQIIQRGRRRGILLCERNLRGFVASSLECLGHVRGEKFGQWTEGIHADVDVGLGQWALQVGLDLCSGRGNVRGPARIRLHARGEVRVWAIQVQRRVEVVPGGIVVRLVRCVLPEQALIDDGEQVFALELLRIRQRRRVHGLRARAPALQTLAFRGKPGRAPVRKQAIVFVPTGTGGHGWLGLQIAFDPCIDQVGPGCGGCRLHRSRVGLSCAPGQRRQGKGQGKACAKCGILVSAYGHAMLPRTACGWRATGE